jgi:hypothetical protein
MGVGAVQTNLKGCSMKLSRLALCAALALGTATAANAGAIIAPISGVIDSGGPGFGLLSQTFDQSGLLTGYTPGVTDFDTYIAGNPQHDFVFSGNEWFSNQGTTSAQVTYDFGSVVSIDAFALWHEDASGFTRFAMSADGNPNFLFGSPADNPINSNYGPQVFTFGQTISTRYLTLAMDGCPQAPDNGFNACAIGEVAFRTGGVVPEPSTWALMILGFGTAGAMLRRRSHAVA